MTNRRRNIVQAKNNVLPPIMQDDDGELPFFKSDMFSDLTISVGQRKLFTSRCLLAYNSPVFEKQLASVKKQQDLDWSSRSLDDIVELLCYLDPRVPYTITAQTAKQLLPLSEEFEMYKLRLACENALFTSYEKIRKEHKIGQMPSEVNEEYLVLADRYKFDTLLFLCMDEFVNSPQDTLKTLVDSDTLSETVKLMILEKKYKRLNAALDRERKYKTDMEYRLKYVSPKRRWTHKFDLY